MFVDVLQHRVKGFWSVINTFSYHPTWTLTCNECRVPAHICIKLEGKINTVHCDFYVIVK